MCKSEKRLVICSSPNILSSTCRIINNMDNLILYTGFLSVPVNLLKVRSQEVISIFSFNFNTHPPPTINHQTQWH